MSRKKPTAQLKREGTFRPIRHGNDQLPIEVPAMPAGLNPSAQAFWNVVTAQLERAGLISFIDGPLLRIASESWDLYLKAGDEIDKHGLLIEEISAQGVARMKANPAVAIRTTSWTQIERALKMFGMSPVARTGLHTSGKGDVSDEEELVDSILKMA